MKFSLNQPFDDASVLNRLRQQNGNPKKNSASVWRDQLTHLKFHFLKTTFFSLIIAVCTSGASLLSMRLLKREGNTRGLILDCVLFFIFSITAHFFNFLCAKVRCEVRLLSESRLIKILSEKIFNLSSEASTRQSSGNLKVLLQSDVKSLANLWDHFFRNLIPAIVSLMVITPFIWKFSGEAGIFSIGVMALFLPLSYLLNIISTAYKTKSMKELDDVTTLQGEWIKNIRLVRALSMSAFIENSIRTLMKRYLKLASLNHFIICLIFGLSVSWWMIALIGFFSYNRYYGVEIELPKFFAYLWLLTFLSYNFVHLPGVFRSLADAIPALERMNRLLAEEETSSQYLKPSRLDPIQKDKIREGIIEEIIFHEVGYSYESKSLFSDLSFSISLKKRSALIGKVSTGKTTLLKLMIGELKPTHGKITFRLNSGEVYNMWEKEAHEFLRSQVAFVPQEAMISADSLLTNITFQKECPQSKKDSLEHSLSLSELEKDLTLFLRGLEEEIGESGVNLSGGQKIRVSLARAVFSGRPYLLLDDMMSALDVKTEKKIMKNLLSESVGFLLVTHRIFELEQLDEVLVLEDGKMIERGKPSDLMKNAESHFMKVLSAYGESHV